MSSEMEKMEHAGVHVIHSELDPDSGCSSPRSREADSELSGSQKWEDSGSRVRFMCSFGGKIVPRPHDNQLSYMGGDTRILAVDRNIRFANLMAKLSSLWGNGVSFKYQLPNEDLDSLISVTNDEDLENMMAEYDRLLKSGYKLSRLRLFVFPPKAESATGHESSKREHWFVDALNAAPVQAQGVSRSDAWVSNVPDYLFGLDNAPKEDRRAHHHHHHHHHNNNHGHGHGENSNTSAFGHEGHNRKHNVGHESEGTGQPSAEVQSGPNSPMPGFSSYDSNSSARVNSPVEQISDNESLRENYGLAVPEQFLDSVPAAGGPDHGFRAATDRAANINPTKVVVPNVGEAAAKRRHDLAEFPLHDQFQKLEISRQQQELQRVVAEEVPPNLAARKRYPDDFVRVVGGLPPQRPNPGQVYLQKETAGTIMAQQNPSEHWQNQLPPQFVQQPGQAAMPYWQMQGDQSAFPVYYVPAPASQMVHNANPGRPTGYYPVQRVNAPVVYSADSPCSNPIVTTVRATAGVQRPANTPEVTDPYRDHVPVPVPNPNPPVTTAQGQGQGQVTGIQMYGAPPPPGMVLRPPEAYVMYEPNHRQVYYTQQPSIVNPQYQAMSKDALQSSSETSS